MASNEELVQRFLAYGQANGLSILRLKKYAFHLKVIDRYLAMPFEKAEKPDLEVLMAKIEGSHYAEWTKCDFKTILRRFWKWLKQWEDGYPPEVRWIKTSMKNHKHRLPDEILTQDEVKHLLDAALTVRDKALIATLYESGCRIGELMGLKIKNIQFNTHGAVIYVFGKTGSRRILLIDSIPYLANWLSVHPSREQPEAPLWVDNIRKGMLCYGSIRKIIRVTAKKAGVLKRINPHSFRHARATHLAKILTEAQMKEYFGWVQASDMASVYVHLSGRDVDEAILAMHGIKEQETMRQENVLKLKNCSRCEQKNPATAKCCNRCGLPLDLKEALEQEQKLEDFAQLINTPEILEKLIERKIEQMLLKKKIIDREVAKKSI